MSVKQVAGAAKACPERIKKDITKKNKRFGLCEDMISPFCGFIGAKYAHPLELQRVIQNKRDRSDTKKSQKWP